jgi:hypothetical protein
MSNRKQAEIEDHIAAYWPPQTIYLLPGNWEIWHRDQAQQLVEVFGEEYRRHITCHLQKLRFVAGLMDNEVGL